MHTQQAFCHPECDYLVPWEKDQKPGQKHKCTRYACYVTHSGHHPHIWRVAECDYFNNGGRKMNKPTKGELYQKINRLEQDMRELRHALNNREVKISELRATISNLKDECAHRLDQFKVAMKERNELKGAVNDLSFKDSEIDALRKGVDGRDKAIDKLQRDLSYQGQRLGEADGTIATLQGELDHLKGEYENVLNLNEGLVQKNSDLKDRLIRKAGQFRDAQTENYGYTEQRKRDEGTISELESKVKHLQGAYSLVCKHRDKLKKYETFFTMLKELGDSGRPTIINNIKGG
jgi:chromosome segregation ATPase